MKTMPQWLKVVLIVVGIGFGLSIIAGVAGAVALFKTYEKLEDAVEKAQVDGEIAGIGAKESECVQAAIRYSGECEGIRFLCLPQVDAFLDGCLDEAWDDPHFCEGIPSSEDFDTMQEWARQMCGQHGREDDIACTMGLTPANVTCWTRRNP